MRKAFLGEVHCHFCEIFTSFWLYLHIYASTVRDLFTQCKAINDSLFHAVIMLFVLITYATRKRLLPGATTTLNLSQNPLRQKQNLESLLNTTKLTRDDQVQVLFKNTVQYINVCMTLNANL